MSIDPKTVVRNFYSTTDAIAAGSAPASALDEVLDTALIVHMPDRTSIDRDGFRAVNHAFAQGFPGSVHTIEELIGEGEKVVARLHWRGVHTGEFQSAPPTGNTIELAENGIMRVTEGRIVEFWPLFDSLALMLGVGIAKI